MELTGTIKKIVDNFGKAIITEHRFINMVADYHSFNNNPAEKRVIHVFINDGYSIRLLKAKDNLSIIDYNSICNEIVRLYGFREDLVKSIIHSFIIGLNIELVNDGQNGKEADAQSKDTSFQMPSTHIQSSTKTKNLIIDGKYTEDGIVGLFPILFERYRHLGHAHMDAQKLMNIMNISVEEANHLFVLLVKMGAYRYNSYSDDYDINVESSEMLRRLFRNFHFSRNSYKKILPTTVNHNCLESAMRKMVKRGFTNIEVLRVDLGTHSNEADVIFNNLLDLHIVNAKGQFVGVYLTPNTIADKILRKL